MLSTVVFGGSVLEMLYAVFYIQQLSVAIGIDSGIYAASGAYNITLTQADMNFIAGLPSLGHALQFSYLLLALALTACVLAVLQLFQSKTKVGNMTIVSAAVFYSALALVLETSFGFAEPYLYFAIAAIGASLIIAPTLYIALAPKPAGKRMARNISMNPLTPYSNMLKLSGELTSKLHGDLKVLDMHFDSAGLRNLAMLLTGSEGNFHSVSVLTKRERLDAKLIRECRDFAEEMRNKGVGFLIRIMNDEDSGMQHERLMLDDRHAYKIPPLNIINRKSEHIVSIGHAEAAKRFDYVWGRGTKLDNLQQA